MKNKNEITIPIQLFNMLFIESFRYSLEREYTGATIDCAERCIEYWERINKSFQEQIRNDAKRVIELGILKEKDSIQAWEKVLKLKVKENYDW